MVPEAYLRSVLVRIANPPANLIDTLAPWVAADQPSSPSRRSRLLVATLPGLRLTLVARRQAATDGSGHHGRDIGPQSGSSRLS
ncbi:hypothetical protein [Paraburkholderia sp.]|uniref:hypothetical protein n=1 Tax=Paraburkholderia sp. TaxID=1926495 RepID=UPI0039C95C6A